MSDIRLKLSPPWITYVHELEALFDPDPQIAFNTDFNTEEGPSVTLAVAESAGDKATAIANLLPEERYFGNIVLKINVDGKFTNRAFTTAKELFETAFEGNPVFAYAVAPAQEGYWYPNITYVVFKNCVVQFFNDNLNDCHGIVSILYEDIADDVFFEFVDEYVGGNVCFNTDVEAKLGMPLGEWP